MLVHTEEAEIEKKNGEFIQPQSKKIDDGEDKDPLFPTILVLSKSMLRDLYLVIENVETGPNIHDMPTKAIIRS